LKPLIAGVLGFGRGLDHSEPAAHNVDGTGHLAVLDCDRREMRYERIVGFRIVRLSQGRLEGREVGRDGVEPAAVLIELAAEVALESRDALQHRRERLLDIREFVLEGLDGAEVLGPDDDFVRALAP